MTAAARLDPTLGDPFQPAPGTIVVTASRVRDYDECPRRYYLRSVLQLAADPIDDTPASSRGLAAHAELHARHVDAARHNETGFVDPESSGDSRVLRFVENHRALCPGDAGATYVGGELDLRWFIARQNLLLTGRVDAVWRWPDGTIEVRDYKTGVCPDTLRHDVGAAFYALLARAGFDLPNRVRVTYERLGGEHAGLVTWDLDSTDLQQCYARLETFCIGIRTERGFEARPSAAACGRCGYRRLCPSAAPLAAAANSSTIVDGDIDTTSAQADPF